MELAEINREENLTESDIQGLRTTPTVRKGLEFTKHSHSHSVMEREREREREREALSTQSSDEMSERRLDSTRLSRHYQIRSGLIA